VYLLGFGLIIGPVLAESNNSRKQYIKCKIYGLDKIPEYSKKLSKKRLLKYRKIYNQKILLSLANNINEAADLKAHTNSTCILKINQCVAGQVVGFNIYRCSSSEFKIILKNEFSNFTKLPSAPHTNVWSSTIIRRVSGEMLMPGFDYAKNQSEKIKYYNAITKAISSNWIKPENSLILEQCDIEIKQSKQGLVISYQIKKCSSQKFKKSVGEAMRKTRQLPMASMVSIFNSNLTVRFRSGVGQ